MFHDLLELFAQVQSRLGIIGGISLIIYLVLQANRPLVAYSKGHWHQRIDGLQGTTHDFYDAVQAALREQNLPDVHIKIVPFYETNVLGDRRDYLRVRRGEHIFDLCVAPFGNTFFISSWLSENPRLLLNFLATWPILGWFVRIGMRLFDPLTYYKVDGGLMFQGAVHACVLQVLDQMLNAQGLDPLPETERKPIMRELYPRKTTVPA